MYIIGIPFKQEFSSDAREASDNLREKSDNWHFLLVTRSYILVAKGTATSNKGIPTSSKVTPGISVATQSWHLVPDEALPGHDHHGAKALVTEVLPSPWEFLKILAGLSQVKLSSSESDFLTPQFIFTYPPCQQWR